jgi:NADH:ubiquinone oxidoreductase subunit B-like Fe-S oxidoreductase
MLPVIGTGACATRGTTFVLSLADVVVRKQGQLWVTGCTVTAACLAGSFLNW